jgi:hypothetical protein
MNILASRTLWASDVRKLNDSTEFEHGLIACLKALERIRQPSFRPHVEMVKHGLTERFRQQTFVACFSMFNNIESQWDSYADSQRGFVVTFDSLVLSALSAPPGLRMMPVEYSDGAKVTRTAQCVERALEDLEAGLEGQSPNLALWTVHARFTLLAADLFYLCTSFKDAKWSVEREWRLIYTRAQDEKSALPIKTRMSGGQTVTYVEIDLTRRYTQHDRPTFAAVRGGPLATENSASLVQKYLREFEKATKWEEQPAFP